MAARNPHELRSPMTRAKRRIHPFHQETAWSLRNAIRSVPHEFDTFRQSGDDLMRALRHTARFSDASNIVENVRKACWLKVHYLWRTWQGLGEPRNRAITDRADVAQFLGKNYVRAQVPQKRLVDCVNCAFVAQCPPHPLINF